MPCKICATSSAGESLTSSEPGLNAAPSTHTDTPARSPPASSSARSAVRDLRRRLILSTSRSSPATDSTPSRQMAELAFRPAWSRAASRRAPRRRRPRSATRTRSSPRRTSGRRTAAPARHRSIRAFRYKSGGVAVGSCHDLVTELSSAPLWHMTFVVTSRICVAAYASLLVIRSGIISTA
jgi:hypothetical protein